MKTILSSIAAALAITSIASITAVATMTAAHADELSVRIKPGHRYHMPRAEFRQYRNAYQLETGQVVQFSQTLGHYLTRVDNGEAVEIFPVADGVFETGAGARIAFRERAETIVISNAERLPLAAGLPANTTLMASR